RIFNPYKTKTLPYGKFYINGNYMDGSPTVTNNNWLGVVMDKGTEADAVASKVDIPFAAESISTQTAINAYNAVLKNVGATLPKRDTLDERIINEVKSRTGRLIDVQGGFAHGTDYSLTVNAWPTLQSAPAPADTDKDGMPDEWEEKNKLNPKDASDAMKMGLDAQYSNVEVYVNSLIK
ncbi:MAG: pectate lyase, partial [Segetibacter sp.]